MQSVVTSTWITIQMYTTWSQSRISLLPLNNMVTIYKHIFILHDYLHENFVRYSFIHFKTA